MNDPTAWAAQMTVRRLHERIRALETELAEARKRNDESYYAREVTKECDALKKHHAQDHSSGDEAEAERIVRSEERIDALKARVVELEARR